MHGRARLRSPLPLLLLLAAAVLLVVPSAALAGWDGMQDVNLGDKIAAEFGVDDGSTHVFTFFAPKDTMMDVKAKAGKGSDLVLGFEVWTLEGDEVTLAGASASGFRKVTLPSDGWYQLHVSATSGSGTYALTTKGKFPKKVPFEGAEDEVSFGALMGSRVKAVVKGDATFAALTTQGDFEWDFDSAKVSVPEALPVSNVYTFELDITSGTVSGTVGIKAPRSKRSWSFGMAEVGDTPTAFWSKWLSSPHNDRTAEAFHHWDADGAVSDSCAKCHSSTGYQDWVAASGLETDLFESIDNGDAPLGTTIDCNACHNPGTETLTTCLFPSGERIDDLGREARCMQCHQGRESGKDVDELIAGSAAADDDSTDPYDRNTNDTGLRFLNVHYLPAAATLYGRQAWGGYEYPNPENEVTGREYYPGRFYHVKAYDTCIECHDPHSTELRIDACATCHVAADGLAVENYDDLHEIRMTRTLYDYDGDSDTDEGIAMEIAGMRAKLYEAMQAYANGNPACDPIEYDDHAYPYFFNDAGSSYNTWTPRLLRAAYNLQYATKDPGGFAHNARYIMALIYDSYTDLESTEFSNVGTTLTRGETGGHFDASSEAYRHWDEDGDTSASCAQCHSPDGFQFYVTYTTADDEVNPLENPPLPEGMRCESCHVDNADFAGDPARRTVEAVWFPGAEESIENTDSEDYFLCLTCHQGRESKATVDTMIDLSELGEDEVASGTVGRGKAGEPDKLSFKNVHYLPAGGTLFGTDAQVAYEYDYWGYNGMWEHKDSVDGDHACTFCHLSDHSFEPQAATNCKGCHGQDTALEDYRENRAADYDGDELTTTLHEEVLAFEDRLLEAIYDYAADASDPIVYDGDHHPYWFLDADEDGVADVYPPEHEDAGERIAYTSFTPRLVRACFNYQYSHKEPGAWAHNTIYVLQILYDSMYDLEDWLETSFYTNGLYVDEARTPTE